MKKKILMSNIIEEDFKVKNRNEVLELKFLRSISKSKVYLSKKTGLVFHKDRMDLRKWNIE